MAINIDLKGQTTVVIGGARGIGAAVVRGASDCGSNVVWTCLDTTADTDASEELLKDTAKAGVESFYRTIDCRDENSTIGLVDEIKGRFAKVDNLVYSAGFTSPLSMLDIDAGEWRRVIDINLNGAFISVRAVIETMAEAGSGSIVLIGSAAVVSGGGGRADYVSAKAGFEGLNRAITKEFSPYGIRCNLVHPSLVETDLLKQRYPDPDKRKELAMQVPLRRLGQPEDIARVTLFLLSDMASYITGQSIFVDGGRTFCK